MPGYARGWSDRRAITARGSAVFGGKREHDDLVIAVALAVWGGVT